MAASEQETAKTPPPPGAAPDAADLQRLALRDIRGGDLPVARERLRAAVAVDPRSVSAWRNLAGVCQDLDLWSEAVGALRRAAILDPAAGEVRFALAWALTAIGRIGAAQATYRQLAKDPAWQLRALTRIAHLRPALISAEEVSLMAAAANEVSEPLATRVGLWFGLGLALEARGEVAGAFDAFASGNRLQRAGLEMAAPADRPGAVLAAHRTSAQIVRQTFDPHFIAGQARLGDGETAPIFIVGMPRSGSTLIEQILASHRDVSALGETAILPALLERQYPGPSDSGFATSWPDLAGHYLQAARAKGWRAGRLVDKTLENYLHVGAISLMFPRAVILHSVRDPLDTCFACWRTQFNRGAETLYDLEEIAAEYLAYAALMDHWRTVLPGRVVDIALEGLIADPATATKALLKACDLSWDPACLRFWESDHPVRTASAAQVRSPMSAAGVGRWRRYADRLLPLREALGSVLSPG